MGRITVITIFLLLCILVAGTAGSAAAANNKADEAEYAVPVVDLSKDDESLIPEIARACQTPGFFQVIHHGISQELMTAFREQLISYYDLPMSQKKQWKRHASNARGFFDDELTQQRLDWKQGLDIGVPGSRDWSIDDYGVENDNCLDGYNPFPPTELLPDYRRITVEYFQACEKLSDRLAILMARGLQNDSNSLEEDALIRDLRTHHSSYLRTNYYPPFHNNNMTSEDVNLGISPHRDAGFLTVLLQDDECHSLQVPHPSGDGWTTVQPIPGALTINTGDMAQVWSNGKYQAPLHRVLTHTTQPRYSAPFFYNPPYHSTVQPMTTTPPLYHPILWAYFRGLRFAGDLTDLGVEIQIKEYEIMAQQQQQQQPPSVHLERQEVFARLGLAKKPFDVEQYRQLFLNNNSNNDIREEL